MSQGNRRRRFGLTTIGDLAISRSVIHFGLVKPDLVCQLNGICLTNTQIAPGAGGARAIWSAISGETPELPQTLEFEGHSTTVANCPIVWGPDRVSVHCSAADEFSRPSIEP